MTCVLRCRWFGQLPIKLPIRVSLAHPGSVIHCYEMVLDLEDSNGMIGISVSIDKAVSLLNSFNPTETSDVNSDLGRSNGWIRWQSTLRSSLRFINL
jgi:hypothetical protein